MRMRADRLVLLLVCVCYGITALSLIVLISFDIKYGDPKNITTNPEDPRLETGSANYMDEPSYQRYRSIVGPIHYTGWLSGVIGFVFLCLYAILKKHYAG